MIWALLSLILARFVRRGLKCALRRVQNIFMPKNTNCIAIVTTSVGIEEKAKKNSQKSTSFTNAIRKRQQTLKWFPGFDWLFTLSIVVYTSQCLLTHWLFVLTFHWFISAG